MAIAIERSCTVPLEYTGIGSEGIVGFGFGVSASLHGNIPV